MALLAAALFGVSTPFAKLLVGDAPPVMLAGLLYLGSGVGLLGGWLLRGSARSNEAPVSRADLPWLAGAIALGGALGPVLLMLGLTTTPASTASLLLNLEAVLTAGLAWVVYGENFDRRIFTGMVFIVAGGVFLAWDGAPGVGVPWGPLAVAGACLCWALDNNLTRRIAASDPVQIAGTKGLVAGVVNIGIALALGASLPAGEVVVSAGLLGFFGYGVSLVFFVLSLRHLGTARTGAYFSTAPFLGAAVALVLLGETPGAAFWVAAALMAAGVWLHLTERHEHVHVHEPLRHAHRHVHDEHHQHTHDFPCDEREAHSHVHEHPRLVHSHPHYPDIHHRHRHGSGANGADCGR